MGLFCFILILVVAAAVGIAITFYPQTDFNPKISNERIQSIELKQNNTQLFVSILFDTSVTNSNHYDIQLEKGSNIELSIKNVIVARAIDNPIQPFTVQSRDTSIRVCFYFYPLFIMIFTIVLPHLHFFNHLASFINNCLQRNMQLILRFTDTSLIQALSDECLTTKFVLQYKAHFVASVLFLKGEADVEGSQSFDCSSDMIRAINIYRQASQLLKLATNTSTDDGVKSQIELLTNIVN